MTRKKPEKKFFKPKKPINKMTEEELDEFAKFVFDNLIGDIEDESKPNEKSQ